MTLQLGNKEIQLMEMESLEKAKEERSVNESIVTCNNIIYLVKTEYIDDVFALDYNLVS